MEHIVKSGQNISAPDLSSRRRECVLNKRVKSVTTLSITVKGRSGPLENCSVPRTRRRRPETVMRNMKSGSHGFWMEYRPSRSHIGARPSRSRPRSRSLHMRIVGGSRRTRGVALLWARQQDIVHWENGQTGPRERGDLSPRRLFTFAHLSRKTPFPGFFDQNKSCVQLCIRDRIQLRPLDVPAAWTSRIPRPVVFFFPSVFLSDVVHGHAWPLAVDATRISPFVRRLDFDVFLASSYIPGNVVFVDVVFALPIAAAIVFTTAPDVGKTTGKTRNENLLRFSISVVKFIKEIYYVSLLQYLNIYLNNSNCWKDRFTFSSSNTKFSKLREEKKHGVKYFLCDYTTDDRIYLQAGDAIQKVTIFAQ